ncbi:MAG: hypothetical protein WAX89_00200 [Alphaproteobacteria bacterium]
MKMPISEKLAKLNLISGDKVCKIFDKNYSDILSKDYASESAFVKELWERYSPEGQNLNGKVFEGILATLFYRSAILPLYVQAEMTFVPNVEFDFVAYTQERGPIILSAKTSLRERYKQADLEGMMLRQVHRKALSYLITLDETEALGCNKKIEAGKILGLDKVIVATSKDFDSLITQLKSFNYIKPNKIDVITSMRLIQGGL